MADRVKATTHVSIRPFRARVLGADCRAELPAPRAGKSPRSPSGFLVHRKDSERSHIYYVDFRKSYWRSTLAGLLRGADYCRRRSLLWRWTLRLLKSGPNDGSWPYRPFTGTFDAKCAKSENRECRRDLQASWRAEGHAKCANFCDTAAQLCIEPNRTQFTSRKSARKITRYLAGANTSLAALKASSSELNF
jgi:hypothetical protein